MGNYESFKTGATVEADIEEEGYEGLDRILNEMLRPDLIWAAEVTGTHNSYVLTWNADKYNV